MKITKIIPIIEPMIIILLQLNTFEFSLPLEFPAVETFG
jgi:hypothetical protein